MATGHDEGWGARQPRRPLSEPPSATYRLAAKGSEVEVLVKSRFVLVVETGRWSRKMLRETSRLVAGAARKAALPFVLVDTCGVEDPPPWSRTQDAAEGRLDVIADGLRHAFVVKTPGEAERFNDRARLRRAAARAFVEHRDAIRWLLGREISQRIRRPRRSRASATEVKAVSPEREEDR
jgi:hypothetical protein